MKCLYPSDYGFSLFWESLDMHYYSENPLSKFYSPHDVSFCHKMVLYLIKAYMIVHRCSKDQLETYILLAKLGVPTVPGYVCVFES